MKAWDSWINQSTNQYGLSGQERSAIDQQVADQDKGRAKRKYQMDQRIKRGMGPYDVYPTQRTINVKE